MIRSGTKPLKRQPRRHFHQVYGDTSPYNIPDFTLDKGLWNGDQNADGAPTECTGYTVARILTNLTGIVRDPDFAYAAALFIEGVGPTTEGADFHAAMQAAVAVGSLAMNAADFEARIKGELFVSDFANWTAQQKTTALKTVQNGTLNALGNGDAFNSLLSTLYTGKISVSIGTPWFWGTFDADGILPVPDIKNITGLPWHDWVIEGKKTINGVPYLIGYPHQGEGFGARGYVYLSREAINAALSVDGTGAITFDPQAIRWVQLLGILIQRFPALAPKIPQLISAWNG